MEMPNWVISKPYQKDKIGFAVFEDNFSTEQKSNVWSYLSDEKANVDISNNQLHISFKSYNFPRSIQ